MIKLSAPSQSCSVFLRITSLFCVFTIFPFIYDQWWPKWIGKQLKNLLIWATDFKQIWVRFIEELCCRPAPPLWPPAVSLQIPSPVENFHGSCRYLPSPRLPGAHRPMSGSRPAVSAPPSAPLAQLAGPVWHKLLLHRLSGGPPGRTPASVPPGPCKITFKARGRKISFNHALNNHDEFDVKMKLEHV